MKCAAKNSFAAGAVMRKHGRGKRWLLLRRWKTVRGSKRAELRALFAVNRRAVQSVRVAVSSSIASGPTRRDRRVNFVNGWIDALRWQRLPEMDRLGEFLFQAHPGIAAYCDHPVRFGVVESINTTIKAVLRSGREVMRDEVMLVLKLKWLTARPSDQHVMFRVLRRMYSSSFLELRWQLLPITLVWPDAGTKYQPDTRRERSLASCAIPCCRLGHAEQNRPAGVQPLMIDFTPHRNESDAPTAGQ